MLVYTKTMTINENKIMFFNYIDLCMNNVEFIKICFKVFLLANKIIYRK